MGGEIDGRTGPAERPAGARRVTIARLESPGNYSNVRIELSDEIAAGESNAHAMARVIRDVEAAMIQALHRRRLVELLDRLERQAADLERLATPKDLEAAAVLNGARVVALHARDAARAMLIPDAQPIQHGDLEALEQATGAFLTAEYAASDALERERRAAEASERGAAEGDDPAEDDDEDGDT